MESTANKDIQLAVSFKARYLDSPKFLHRELPAKLGFVKTYLIKNKPVDPVFKGVLSIMADGRAVLEVSYVANGGRKYKYLVFFNKEGREIIHSTRNTQIERKYWDSL